ADFCQDFDKSQNVEWLLTNGLGGYASSTVSGANTRAYHGLLAASLKPPIRRYLILSSLEESVAIEDRLHPVSTHVYQGPFVKDGYHSLAGFSMDPFPTWTFECEDVVLERTVFMPYGENAVLIFYRLLQSAGPFRLIVKPLAGFRPIHSLGSENGRLNRDLDTKRGHVTFTPYPELPPLYFAHDAAILDKSGYWYNHFEYPAERERGLNSEEDLYNPFTLIYSMSGKATAFLYASFRPVENVQPEKLFKQELERRSELVPAHFKEENPNLRALLLAADQFIVRKKDEFKGIIAGYPWFNEWGRDTMIAFHGLTLTTGRYDIAKEVLLSAAGSIEQGMLPAFVNETDGSPYYLSADASLWFIHACFKYLEYTEDYRTIERYLFPKIIQIIKSYQKGNPPYLFLDRDSLVEAGTPAIAMTWMDASLGGEAVTARQGKAVEVNALWYNALSIAAFFADYFKAEKERGVFAHLAHDAYVNFNKLFWQEDLGYLADVVRKDERDTSFRPNQLLAMSLPFHILEENDVKWKSILERAERELVTPCGLRSLSNHDKDYRGIYAGDQKHRDMAYHEGSVWPWFWGFYVAAYLKVYGLSKTVKTKLRSSLDDFLKHHLREACLGSVSELFDGDPPHSPRGCFAQAWSVGEILRAYEELGVHLFEHDEKARHFALR
ncbi:MAG: amylo-alpha-1,6-glucosidase, partial [Candidatus Omnitrophica bacterium]|nr:amylo-alpha-1,6-glucosidase [Candidatus Omnitrophota bacterium]